MDDISFEDAKHEAWALEAALRLVVEHARPDLALEICAKASPARRALATWTRILALAAQKDANAAKEATALAEEWLRPADSLESASQVLPRAHVLRAIDAVGGPRRDPRSRGRGAGARRLHVRRGRRLLLATPQVFPGPRTGVFLRLDRLIMGRRNRPLARRGLTRPQSAAPPSRRA